MESDERHPVRPASDFEAIETRLWQVGFRLIYGRDHEYYALAVHGPDERHAIRVTTLVRACRWGYMTAGHLAAACCRLVSVSELDD